MKHTDINQLATTLAKDAIESGAFCFNTETPWKWASGVYMPVYNDNRLLLAKPRTRKLVYQGLAYLCSTIENSSSIDAVAGCATGGIAPALGLADLLEVEFLYVRSQAKSHGTGKNIEGANPSKKNLVVVEDLISTGGSSLAVIEALEKAGGTVLDCLAIFSYELEKANENFNSKNHSYRSLLDFDILMQEAESLGRLGRKQIDSLSDWRTNPFAWGEKNGFVD